MDANPTSSEAKESINHISFSQLQMWHQCPYYHALSYIDKKLPKVTSPFFAFGTAIHETCQKSIQKELIGTEQQNEYFLKALSRERNETQALLCEEYNKLFVDFEHQGQNLLLELDATFSKYFGNFEVVSIEEEILMPLDKFPDVKFKGYIDMVLKEYLPEGGKKYHIIDIKSCSWGWNAEDRSDTMKSYQLALYKHFFCKKHNIDPSLIETHFCLLKRTAPKERVEPFRISSGKKKLENAVDMMNKAVANILKGNRVKNKLSCGRCPGKLKGTEFCK